MRPTKSENDPSKELLSGRKNKLLTIKGNKKIKKRKKRKTIDSCLSKRLLNIIFKDFLSHFNKTVIT